MSNKLDHSLYKRTNYTDSSISFIENTNIIEYDMKNAGMNILRTLGYVSNDSKAVLNYDDLINMKKIDRVITIGKALRNNPKMNEDLENGFEECRRIFMESNNINKDDILSIKKDAIYVIEKHANNLRINDYIRFEKKNQYDTYISLMEKEHYININEDIIDVKGYSKETIEHHKDYLFKFLLDVVKMNRDMDKIDVAEALTIFKHKYVTRSLDKGYYKSLADNKYMVEFTNSILGIPDINEMNENISINYNLTFILEIINRLM